jgi:signal transduction histidine kinase
MIDSQTPNPTSTDSLLGQAAFAAASGSTAGRTASIQADTYPARPPRVRLEWLVATARIVLGAGALLARALLPVPTTNAPIVDVVLTSYLLYSVVLLLLVWRPFRFGPGWDLVAFVSDLVAFSVLSFLTVGTTSPFYLYFIFLVICGTLRWQSWGAFWATASAIAAYAGISWYAVNVLHDPAQAWDAFAIRSVHLTVVAVLIAYMGAYQQRYQEEIRQLASWPRKFPANAEALVREILVQSTQILEAPRLLLAWEEPDEETLNLAWLSSGRLLWTHEAETPPRKPLVSAGLEGKNFQTSDASSDRSVVTIWKAGSFRKRVGRSVDPTLRERFAMRAMQSWMLDGELVRGRLFCLDKNPMRLDGLGFGLLVARLAVSRLDSLYLLKRLRDATAVEERLRLARDVHDSLIQSVAGSALQLLAARRLLDRDPGAARRRLEDVQNQLERGELEMRSFIGRLRPLPPPARPIGAGLTERLEELRRRVESEWETAVRIQIHEATEGWPDVLAGEVYQIVQEGVLNAARHADASVITVDVSATESRIRIGIVDDGRGFPFQGTYDLAALNAANRGPLTLRERVAELRGELVLTSSANGAELQIRLPLLRLASVASSSNRE